MQLPFVIDITSVAYLDFLRIVSASFDTSVKVWNFDSSSSELQEAFDEYFGTIGSQVVFTIQPIIEAFIQSLYGVHSQISS